MIECDSCKGFGTIEKAEYECIENGEKYCKNCMILMNVNGAGEKINDYHFRKLDIKKED